MTSIILLKSMLFTSVLQKSKKKKKFKAKKTKVRNTIDLKLCRICNDRDGEISIFDNLSHPNISEEIKNFSGVSIEKNDNFPKSICQNCLDLLNGCIVFRDMCQMNNKIFIEVTIKKENTNINVNESACDDVMQESDDSYNIPSPTFSDEDKYQTSQNSRLADSKRSILPKDQSEEAIKKSFLCDICGKTTRSNANLLVHMGTHENNFPFKCEQCPYQGRTRDLLKVHKRSHLADKPYKCTQCPKATTTSSNLAKHMRHVHSTTRPFRCTYCDKAFSYQHDMRRHIRDIHLRQGTVECDVCFKKFNTKKILQGHRWKIHKIKSERHGRLPSYLQCQLEDENKLNESAA